MEALSSSIVMPRLTEVAPSVQYPVSPVFKLPAFRRMIGRPNERLDALMLSNCVPRAQRSCARLRSFAHDVSDSGEAEVESLWDGEGLLPIESNPSSNSSQYIEITGESDIVHPVTCGNGASGSRAGLFRAPISGGVQSATFTHDLPPPALAVRNLMEQARFAQLCTIMSQMHHRRAGYPFGSLVDFATDAMGYPIFSLSPLAIHTRNLLANPRCTLVVQIPGWSGLSNARVTIFGDIFPLPDSQQEWARRQYVAKHQQWASHQWGNFYYYRMQNISDIYFIGGFGTVAWVDVKDYESTKPDKIATNGGERNLKELNVIFSKTLKELLSTDVEIDDAALISIDSKGTDIRVRQGAQFNIQRLSFEVEHAVETLEEAKMALQKLINGYQLKSKLAHIL